MFSGKDHVEKYLVIGGGWVGRVRFHRECRDKVGMSLHTQMEGVRENTCDTTESLTLILV